MGRRPKAAQRQPHFVKVLLGDFSHCLRIPPNFEKNLAGEAHRETRAILEGPAGGTWPVELQRTSQGTFLSEGWRSFVEGNALRGLELLLFRYDGGMHFNVSVFDTTACERGSYREGSGNSTAGGHLRRRKVPPARLIRRHVRADGIGNEEPDSTMGGNMLDCRRLLTGCLPSTPMDVEIKVEKDELPIAAIAALPSSDSRSSALAIARRGSTSAPHRHYGGGAVERRRASLSTERTPRRRTVTGYGYLSRRRPVSLFERERAYEAAHSFTSELPFCVVRMRVSSVYKVFLLMIPKSFAKVHLPRERIELQLEDPAGRAWPVRYLPDGESKLSGGWVSFSRGNNLEEGDLCVLELVRPLELRVHIFRVVEEITPLVRTCWPCDD